MKDKKVLVTGGAGFIGSNLVESLLQYGNYVVCLDNFSTGRKSNISGFLSNPSFRLVEGDIRNYNDCLKSVIDIDVVFHQAALGSVPRSIKDPVTATDVNIGGFVKMLFASKESGVKRFVYAASSSTYGDSQELPKVEERIGKPLSPYAVTKFIDEVFAENLSGLYGIEVIGLRYFNVFGRRQDPEGAYAAVIPKFIKLLLGHQRPVIYGDGSYSRDFTYIDNVILANHLAAIAGEGAVNQVYNVAQGERTAISELFEIIRRLTGEDDKHVLEIEPEYGLVRPGDIPHSQASVEKVKRVLGYKPVFNVEEGLRETVKWFRNNL